MAENLEQVMESVNTKELFDMVEKTAAENAKLKESLQNVIKEANEKLQQLNMTNIFQRLNYLQFVISQKDKFDVGDAPTPYDRAIDEFTTALFQEPEPKEAGVCEGTGDCNTCDIKHD